MSDPSHASNPLKARQLGTELAGLLRSHLQSAARSLFDAIDDTLFDLAEHTQSGDRQRAYFDGMRECRRQRAQIEQTLLQRLDPAAAETVDNDSEGNPLRLVGHEELELKLAASSMVARAEQRCGESLYALNERMAALLGWDECPEPRNPLGPTRLTDAFRAATDGLELAMEVRLILLKLFERHVLEGLDPIYRQCNQVLIAAGVLPTLDLARQRAEPRRKPPAKPAPTAEPAVEEQAAAPTSAAGQEREILDLLLRLLSLRQPGAPAAPGAGAERGTASPVGRVRTAVAPAALEAAASPPAALVNAIERAARRLQEGSPLPAPRQFAAQLLAEARYTKEGLSTTAAHVATVDLVGRVFEEVLRDAQVSPPIQPLLHRLQVPVTRAVLHDPHCLTDPNHPIRQALDLLGETSLGWCPSADPGERLLGQLRTAIDAIAGADSRAEQTRSLDQLTRMLETQQRRAELAEQRVVEAATGRERLWHARRHVHRCLAERLAQHAVPAWVRHLISRPWANYLVLLWLRQGEESRGYREALDFVDSLLWCAAAGGSDVERLRLRALLPVLEGQLRGGLATVAYHEVEIEQLVAELRGFVRYRLGETALPGFLENDAPLGRDVEFFEEEAEPVEDQPAPADLDPVLLERLRSTAPGAWFEFGPLRSDHFERAKLSWVSPYSGRYLFVNRNGMRVADRRPEEIVAELQRGLARVLESANLLQRALGQVLEQLQQAQTARGLDRAG